MQREIVIGAIVVIIAIAAAATLVVKDARRLAVVTPTPVPTAISARPQPDAPERQEASPPPVVTAPQPVQAPRIAAAPTTAQAWTPAPQGRRTPAPVAQPITEPVARDALSWIGADPAADAVYIAAINDPSLAPNQRKNLIEDLNETGFDDPRNLTQNDLPVIEYRLAMIEQLAPSAMDDINAAAFREAQKDLLNMRARLVGQ